MRILSFCVIGLLALEMGCAHVPAQKSTPNAPTNPPKNPLNISLLPNHNIIKQPYTILGKETISKFNCGGNKRPTAFVHDAMRTRAALMGGDAIIDITNDDKNVVGTVIAFQNLTVPKQNA